jgi:hypothetical protein
LVLSSAFASATTVVSASVPLELVTELSSLRAVDETDPVDVAVTEPPAGGTARLVSPRAASAVLTHVAGPPPVHASDPAMPPFS